MQSLTVPNQFDLAGYIDALARRWWLFLLIPLIVVAPVYMLTSGADSKSYTATVTLLVNPASAFTTVTSGDVYASSVLAQTYSQLVGLPEVHARTASRLETQGITVPSTFTLSAIADVSLPILTISATSDSAESTAAVANAAAPAFIDWLADVETTGGVPVGISLEQTVAAAQNDLDRASAELSPLLAKPEPRSMEDNARIGTLQGLVEQRRAILNSLLDLQQDPPSAQTPLSNRLVLMSPAELPKASVSRIPRLAYPVIALLFSLGLAGLIVPGIDLIRPRVWRPADVQRVSSLPVLATIPSFRHNHGPNEISAPGSPTGTAIRLLSGRLTFEMNGKGPGVSAIIGTASGSGTSRFAANLAVVFANAGYRTVLVDTDTEHSQDSGVIRPNGEAQQPAVEEGPTPVGDIADLLVAGPHENLRVLVPTALRLESNRYESGDRIPQLVARLRQVADAVFLVVPDSDANVDALTWVAESDRAVMTVEYGKTTPQALQNGIEQAKVAKVPVVGVVGIERSPVIAVRRKT